MSASRRAKEFCTQALTDRDSFWIEQAKAIHWQRPFDQVCDFSRPPFSRWFVGGKTNICYNAVDRQLPARAAQPALYFISTEVETEKTYTFQELYDEVNTFAAVLRSLGLKRGDRAVIYLPMIPEAAFSILACVRLGIIHSVVFAGFAPASLATRIDDAEAAVLITADIGLRGGKVVPLKQLADEAVALTKLPPNHVLVCNRGLDPKISWTEGRDVDYATLRQAHEKEAVPVEWLDSTESSYLLYTSGTTAKPKGVQRDTGGYASPWQPR